MKISVIETIHNTDLRLTKTNKYHELNEVHGDVNVVINDGITYQTMLGFGGAFTEAAAYTLSRMSEEKRNEVIEKYFHKEKGIGYSIGRTHIHSCDFALENYTYVEDGDKSLETFDISREKKWVLPFIHDAVSVRGEAIEILSSPWSPPAWMKDTNNMNHGGKLLPEYYEAWANYYVKYIEAMALEGVKISAITVQNEPMAVQTWDSCIYTAEEERDFVKNYLGPIMHAAGYEDVKILIWDHNRDIMVERVKTILEDEAAVKYIWGTGFHWYVSEAFENVGAVHNLFPKKHLLFTEGCQEGGVHLGSWTTGERYGRNMIGDINNWCEGYLDWNLVLDETGGPNHVNNLCDAPIIADTTTDTLFYNSSYYYIGHFSKYVLPGAARIDVAIRNEHILGTGFKNKDGSIVLVLMNETDTDETANIILNNCTYSILLEAHSIKTFIAKE